MQQNILEVKSRLLIFSFVPIVMQKVQKVESVNIQNDCKITCKKRTDSSSMFTRSGKVRKGGDWANTQNNYKKQQVKNEQLKRKQTCFVKVFKFQENEFKIVQKNFLKIIINKISWKTHRSWWSLYDKYGLSKAADMQ